VGHMRIKQLELLGFKSFKQKTILTFPPGITAIVGPNGCGKSNIVDALRWVMGEQSPRHLRGQEMSDVVFAGNDRNAPLGMAEVSLILENEPKSSQSLTLGGAEPFRQWNEVMVSRRYFRSGESEYLFNKVPCRLRDIVEFFLGTGAGTRAYAVIEQGRVEHLLNAKPEEVRALIDEAAGVSLYCSRRVAAERKLERTKDNLARVNDLLREMDRQLGSLRRQAKKAEQYRSLQEELKTIDLTLLHNAYHKLSAEVMQLEAQRHEISHRLELLSCKEQELVAERAQAAAALGVEEEALRGVETRWHTIESASRQRQQKRQFLLQQEQDLLSRVAATEQEEVSLEAKLAQVCEESRKLSASVEELQRLLSADEEQLQSYEHESRDLHRALAACEADAEQIKTAIVDLLTREAQEQNWLSYARQRAAEVERRLQTLAREAERIGRVRSEHEQALATILTRVAHLKEHLLHSQQQHSEKTSRLRELVSVGEQLDSKLAAAWAKQAELRARLTTLEEMEARYDRYPQGVRSIMSGAGTPEGICGVVAQVMEVPKEYERAVAAVLREKLEYIIVSGIEDGLKAVEYLRETQAGHGSFIPLTPNFALSPDRSGNGTGNTAADGHAVTLVGEGTTRLLALLTVDQRYRDLAEFLLGDAVLVPDLWMGLQLWRQNGIARTFVTPNGEVITSQGVVSGGSEGFAEEMLLERRREIRVLTEEVGRQDRLVADLVHQHQRIKQSQQELEEEILQLEKEVRSLGQENEALHREATTLDGELRRLLDKNEYVAYERRALESEQQALAQEMTDREEREAAIRTQRQEQEAALAAAQAEVRRVKGVLEQQRTHADGLRVRIAERRERQTSIRGHLSRLCDRQRELGERITSCRAAVEAIKQEIAKVRRDAADLAGRLVQDTDDLAAAAQERALKQESCRQLRTRCHACDEALEQIRSEHARLQDAKTQLEVSLAEKRTACAHIDATIRERYGMTLEEVMGQYGRLSVDEAEGEVRRQELREKIARLGEVNLGAAVELAEVEERYKFLQTQEADLRRSVDDLQRSIAKLNRESRERFRDTFTQVNDKFGEVYARLVEGGKAQLVLTDQEDLAGTGVEIAVQPPGKRLRSLQLLSGGEKALAALSFTFALFLIRPSPFCILDEVDAPLDDANVDRFTKLLREMSQSTQIIVVTHNKRTMEAANTLYGVTMQEPGVSTIVSVRVE
jgi:chromosome segregation protein